VRPPSKYMMQQLYSLGASFLLSSLRDFGIGLDEHNDRDLLQHFTRLQYAMQQMHATRTSRKLCGNR
jgi:hypothetical protein